MASRSHVDVNERRLRPIYDCLDNGNNKKAIQEADKVLKKQKDLQCARVLKALALLRMGRASEGSAILDSIHSSHPTDEQTLSAMAICYKETQQYPLIASLYEAAAKHQPASEDILSSLFMAHVRLGNYQQQQRTAMMLHKVRPSKNPYYFWAVMSIVMQAHKDQRLGKTMYLPLAERMVQKYIKEEKIEAEAEILLYLLILELEEKWEEVLTLLEGPMGAQLGSELNLKETHLANACSKLHRWDRVNVVYKELLELTPDDWHFWLQYLDSGFQMIDADFSPVGENSEGPSPDHSVELMSQYIEEKISAMDPTILLRGPYMAQLQLVKNLKQKNSDLVSSVGNSLDLLKNYFDKFGHKFCCFGDMSLFLELLSEEQTDELLSHVSSTAGVNLEEGEVQYAKDINQMTRHMVSLQLARRAGRHSNMSMEDRLALSNKLLLCYREGLSFGRELLQTDLQYSDNYLLMAVHLLLDDWILTGDDIHIWRAIVHLELGVRDSPANFQFKLLLIRLYCTKGVFGPCPALYDGMEIKHIVNDTMGYIVSNHVVRLGHLMEAGTMYSTMVRFFLVNQKEASEHLMSSYKYGSFGRICEFVEFQHRLDNSLQFHSARTEKMLLDLIIQTDCHDAVEATAQVFKPCRGPPPLDTIVDNRDLNIALCWDPPQQLEPEKYKEKSLEEEKAWLRLRHLQLQVLLAAIEAGVVWGEGVSQHNGHTNGEEESKTSALERVDSGLKELQECAASQSQDYLQPRNYHVIQGPHRTRISTLLAGPHVELMAALRDCLVYVQTLHTDSIDNLEDKKDDTCWLAVVEKAKKLLVKNVEGLFRDVSGRRQLDSTSLELLVASVESMSYLTILAGVCHRGLKLLKASWSKKVKKGKSPLPPQPTTFNNFNTMITELSSITKELHQAASGLDPVFSSLDMSSLRLADLPEEEELQCEAERLVWSRVERSVQQSSREICEVLHHKQFYLNTLIL